MTMPNFLIVGAAKSGTSSLHFYLDQHPEIFMSPEKQTYFFAYEGQNPTFGGPGDQQEMARRLVNRLDDYQTKFDGVTTETAIGEACSVYLCDANAPAAIKHHVPDAKIIMILRDPADRAYSSFMHLMRDGYETVTDFDRALDLEDDRIRDNWRHLWHYRTRGFYHAQIQRYLALFDRSQIKICLFDDLRTDPQGLMRDIFDFLEVDRDFVPDTSGKHNAGGIPKSRAAMRLIMRPNPLKTFFKPLLPKSLRDAVKTFVTQNPKALRKPPLPADARRKLVDAYRDDILALQRLLGRDLSAWLA